MFLFFLFVAVLARAFELQLADEIHVEWQNIGADTWEFKVSTTNIGQQQWVGLGFSNSGGMKGMEAYIFHASSSTLEVKISYDFVTPTHIADHTLQSSNVTDSGISFTFRRKKCSEHDGAFDFKDYEEYLVYAWGIEGASTNFGYHGPTTRGQKMVSILTGPREIIYPVGGETEEFKVKSHAVSTGDNSYSCFWMHRDGAENYRDGTVNCPDYAAWKRDPVNNKCTMPPTRAIGAAEPLHHPASKAFNHHMILFACPLDLTFYWHKAATMFPSDHIHYDDSRFFDCKDSMPQCQEIHAGWAVGADGDVSGPGRGLITNKMTYVLQVHYYNPQATPGIVDKSGFKLYYGAGITENVNQMTLGAPFVNLRILPGKQTVVRQTVPGIATKLKFGKAHVLNSAGPHQHLIGIRMRLRQVKPNGDFHTLFDSYYDFNHQGPRYYSPEPVIEPGDILEFDCTFDPKWKTEITYGGENTQQEMCLLFLKLYPQDSVNDAASLKGSNFMVSLNDPIHGGRWTILSEKDGCVGGKTNPKCIAPRPQNMPQQTWMQIMNIGAFAEGLGISIFMLREMFAMFPEGTDMNNLDPVSASLFQQFNNATLTWMKKNRPTMPATAIDFVTKLPMYMDHPKTTCEQTRGKYDGVDPPVVLTPTCSKHTCGEEKILAPSKKKTKCLDGKCSDALCCLGKRPSSDLASLDAKTLKTTIIAMIDQYQKDIPNLSLLAAVVLDAVDHIGATDKPKVCDSMPPMCSKCEPCVKCLGITDGQCAPCSQCAPCEQYYDCFGIVDVVTDAQTTLKPKGKDCPNLDCSTCPNDANTNMIRANVSTLTVITLFAMVLSMM